MAKIVLEHRFDDREFDGGRYTEAQENNRCCMEAHDVRHVVSYLTPDKRRMICVFEAPDTEAVRRMSRQLGYSYDAVCRATILK